jgi:SPP1 family predicted phage head-tail adaptor
MRAGKLRSKMDLMRLEAIKDDVGDTTEKWVTYAKAVRCDARAVSSREQMRNNVELTEMIYTIEMRYRSDVNSNDRILLHGVGELAIIGPPRPGEDQKKRSMIVTARLDN